MDESGGFDADVDERAEVGDVLYGAAQDGSDLEVGEFDDALARERRGQVFARVAAGFGESGEDVAHGRQAGVGFGGELRCVGCGEFGLQGALLRLVA